jgi:thymidylate synthase
MEVFRSQTVDGVWRQAHAAVAGTAEDAKQPSRAGETLELLHVGLQVDDPRQRWVISRRPQVNPAFAIADALWILAGSNDADVMNYWFPNLPKFAGHGPTYAGAYGHRLRKHFGVDQVKRACDALSAVPESRQVVLQFWDVLSDLPLSDGAPRSADVPCNVISMLKVRDGRLEWTQVLRSNDLFRGLPNNFVQFTLLQEVMAGWLGLDVGPYHQWSDSLHIYTDSLGAFSCAGPVVEETNTDSLTVPADEGEQLIIEMYRRMTLLTEPNLGESQVSELATMGEAPVAYRNLLRVLAAESARRRGRLGQAQALMAGCTNPQLVQVWSGWLERVRGVSVGQELPSSSRGTT